MRRVRFVSRNPPAVRQRESEPELAGGLALRGGHHCNQPLMKKLGHPTLLCNWLAEDKRGFIADYVLRQPNGKKHAVMSIAMATWRASNL